jgi:hypothetical protein
LVPPRTGFRLRKRRILHLIQEDGKDDLMPRAFGPFKHFKPAPTAGRLLCKLALLCVALSTLAPGQELAKRLTNQDVIDMTAMGLSDDVIIAKIRSVSGAG